MMRLVEAIEQDMLDVLSNSCPDGFLDTELLECDPCPEESSVIVQAFIDNDLEVLGAYMMEVLETNLLWRTAQRLERLHGDEILDTINTYSDTHGDSDWKLKI